MALVGAHASARRDAMIGAFVALFGIAPGPLRVNLAPISALFMLFHAVSRSFRLLRLLTAMVHDVALSFNLFTLLSAFSYLLRWSPTSTLAPRMVRVFLSSDPLLLLSRRAIAAPIMRLWGSVEIRGSSLGLRP